MRLMMIESQLDFRTSWIAALESNGFDLDVFSLLTDGDLAMKQMRYEALLVARELQDGDGVDWLRKHRRSGLIAPAVVVVPTRDLENRIRALDAGADDAIGECLDARELVARVKAVIRRQPVLRPEGLHAGNVTLDVASREVSIGEMPLPIPRRELSILELLIHCFNRTVTREFLENSVYGISGDVYSNSIEVRISRLRRCLERHEADVEIKTVRGVGYRLEPRQDCANRQAGAKAKKRLEAVMSA